MAQQKLVRYVPPPGLGSPAWVTREEFAKLDREDQALYAKLRRAAQGEQTGIRITFDETNPRPFKMEWL